MGGFLVGAWGGWKGDRHLPAWRRRRCWCWRAAAMLAQHGGAGSHLAGGPGHGRTGRALARHAHQARRAPGATGRVYGTCIPGWTWALRWPPRCLVLCSTGVRSAAFSGGSALALALGVASAALVGGAWRPRAAGRLIQACAGRMMVTVWSSEGGLHGGPEVPAWPTDGALARGAAVMGLALGFSARAATTPRPRSNPFNDPFVTGDGSRARLPGAGRRSTPPSKCERAHARAHSMAAAAIVRDGAVCPGVPAFTTPRSFPGYSSSSCGMDGSATPVSGCWAGVGWSR